MQNGFYHQYTNGWSFLNRKRDALDIEWETWKKFCLLNLKWFSLHIFCSELCRIFKHKVRAKRKEKIQLEKPFNFINFPFFSFKKHFQYLGNVHALIGCSFIVINYSISIFTIILLKNLLFYYLIKKFKRNSVIWFYGIIWLIIINLLKTEFIQHYVLFKSMRLNESQIYDIIIIFAWNLLKTLSFSLDSIRQHQSSQLLLDEDKSQKMKFMNIKCYLAYTFYFPNLLLGPFWIYERYRKMLELNETFKFDWNDLKFRLQMLIKNMIRILFWLFLMDFALHFLYINHLLYNIEVSKSSIVHVINNYYILHEFCFQRNCTNYGEVYAT